MKYPTVQRVLADFPAKTTRKKKVEEKTKVINGQRVFDFYFQVDEVISRTRTPRQPVKIFVSLDEEKIQQRAQEIFQGWQKEGNEQEKNLPFESALSEVRQDLKGVLEDLDYHKFFDMNGHGEITINPDNRFWGDFLVFKDAKGQVLPQKMSAENLAPDWWETVGETGNVEEPRYSVQVYPQVKFWTGT